MWKAPRPKPGLSLAACRVLLEAIHVAAFCEVQRSFAPPPGLPLRHVDQIVPAQGGFTEKSAADALDHLPADDLALSHNIPDQGLSVDLRAVGSCLLALREAA